MKLVLQLSLYFVYRVVLQCYDDRNNVQTVQKPDDVPYYVPGDSRLLYAVHEGKKGAYSC